MLDVALLSVLLVAIAIGYGLGYRQALRRRHRTHPPAASSQGLSRDYFVGLNYLLNEQPDEAINTFINVLAVNSDTVHTHIALGKLFRARGEADKAVSIHQNLLARPALSQHTNEQIQLELARDFMALGVHDRAQRLLNTLLEHSGDDDHRYAAKQLLVDLLEREKAWQQALDVIQPLLKQYPKMRRPAAHWLCELALEEISEASRPLAKKHLKKALQLDEKCVRATLMLAELEVDNGHYARAIERLDNIPGQEIAHIPTMLPALKHAYMRNNDDTGYEAHLYRLLEQAPYTSTIIALGQLVHHRDGVDKAIELIGERLRAIPSLGGLDYLIDLYIESQRLSGKPSPDTRLLLLKHHTEALLLNRTRHRCQRCGFASDALQWQCPSCRFWGTIKPIIGVEGE
ncbi:lipopolysaccharide assembly protein LapB [Halomonas sp. QX-2]|mgnify:CR=1 FL=1|jgi:lipopolysaccharide biosynthesis regulator YciM|uniref:Lipopolysaccharide assembly protein B n=1 Tax=Vreelandella sedimenti TaxID=2729618 RepID=A0A7Z0SPE1_9GAMM|nr:MULTISPECIES: lipopolysaccharide assembly protein LapB [Halomonas]NYT74198.1 lipopolysaccharide assembly protein LapB [Halomonas sedimenti]|tara:strand:- start:35427 stop:36632 length:1206 start_codon:yes stop_codon:yes gene_type:complete